MVATAFLLSFTLVDHTCTTGLLPIHPVAARVPSARKNKMYKANYGKFMINTNQQKLSDN